MDKAEELRKLGLQRRMMRWEGYACIGDYQAGVYECDFVSPYTKSAGNVNADVFILLQDWASDSMLSGELDKDARDLGYVPRLPTNKNLNRLLQQHFELCLVDVYATNLFPFVKWGGMSRSIPQADLLKAAKVFALPQIQIVAPRLVICLGVRSFNALRVACGLRLVKGLPVGIESPFLYGESQVWCQAHTGALGQNNRNRGGVDRVTADWARMAAAVNISA